MALIKDFSGLLFLLIPVLVWLAVSVMTMPSHLVFSEDLKVKAPIDRWRIAIHGRDFYESQLAIAKNRLREQRGATDSQDDWIAGIDAIDEQQVADMERFYLEHPDMRPSPEERRIQKMRDEADRLEMELIEKEMAVMQQDEIAETERIIESIESALKDM